MTKEIDRKKSKKILFGLSPAFVIFMTILIDMTGFGMIIPLIPFYAKTFQAGAIGIGVLVASFSLMQLIFSPILGKVSDNVGRRPVLLLSLLISSLSFILFTLANSFLLLLLSRVIAGMATEITVARAYMADITSEEERTTGMGRISAAFGAGFIIGPAIGGSLSVYGFWAPGIAAFTLTSLNLLFVFFFLPESIRHKSTSIRITVNSFFGFLSNLANVFSRPLIGIVLVIFFLEELNHSTIPVIVPLLGISFFGFRAIEMSYIFIYIGFVQIILQGFIIGRMAKKFGEDKLIILGILLVMGGMFIMPLIPDIMGFILSITAVASGIGTLVTVIPGYISKKTPSNKQGGMLGMIQSVSSIARIIGPLIAGFIFEFAGLAIPFFLGATLMMIAFCLGVKVILTKEE